jgi:hypothetical protein
VTRATNPWSSDAGGDRALGRLPEEEVEAMPETYRTGFGLRHVKSINAAEVADILNNTRENASVLPRVISSARTYLDQEPLSGGFLLSRPSVRPAREGRFRKRAHQE